MQINIELPPRRKRNTNFKGINVLIPGPKPNSRKVRYNLHVDLSELYQLSGCPREAHSGSPQQSALELVYFAALVYVIDRAFERKRAADGWTRIITAKIPISNAERWGSLALRLSDLLGFLTGDVWDLSFKEEPIFQATGSSDSRLDFSDVCLFSGGADSLAGAINLLFEAKKKEQRVLLVGHYDTTGPRGDQERLFEIIRKRYPDTAQLVQTKIGPPRKASEKTFRSRSLVFLSVGVYAAQSIGDGARLFAPENGPIAINIPLTPSRTGSCSTRTMHPVFLEGFVGVLRHLGIRTEVINRFSLQTKGECFLQCSDRRLLADTVKVSVSCAHPQRASWWIRKDALNCGYCWPCLIRRAALHRLGSDNGAEYGIDIFQGEPIGRDASRDFHAVIAFLKEGVPQESQIERLLKSTATVPDLKASVGVVKRGLEELNELVKAKFRN